MVHISLGANQKVLNITGKVIFVLLSQQTVKQSKPFLNNTCIFIMPGFRGRKSWAYWLKSYFKYQHRSCSNQSIAKAG